MSRFWFKWFDKVGHMYLFLIKLNGSDLDSTLLILSHSNLNTKLAAVSCLLALHLVIWLIYIV